jgi:hypothetical protein
LNGQARTLAALRACYEMYTVQAEPRLRYALNKLGRQLEDNELYLFFGVLKTLPLIWDLLDDDNKNRVKALLRQSNDTTATRLLPVSFTVPGLEDVSKERTNSLDMLSLHTLLKDTKHPVAISRAVDLYCQSGNWDTANSRYHHVLAPVLDDLTASQVKRILVAAKVEGADLYHAISFGNFADYVYANELISRDDTLELLRDNNMTHIVERLEHKYTPR